MLAVRPALRNARIDRRANCSAVCSTRAAWQDVARGQMNNHDTDVRGDSADALLTAPTEIVVSGQRLTLDSHLWRDFQRGAPAPGRPLNAALDVQALDAD